MLYQVTVPGTEYFRNAEGYRITFQVHPDPEAVPGDLGPDDENAVLRGDAQQVAVRVDLYRVTLGALVPVSRDTFYGLYGHVNDVPVSPVPHPQSPEPLEVACELLINAMESQ